MRRVYGLATVLLAALPGPAGAQAPPMPSFPVETVHSQGVREIELVISRASWHLMGRIPKGYRIGSGPAEESTGKVPLFIQACNTTAMLGHGALERVLLAGDYAGRRIRVVGHVRNESKGAAYFYLNAIGREGRMLSTTHLPIISSKGWENLSLVADMPDSAITMDIGITLWSNGRGRVWLDRVTIEGVSSNVPPAGKTEASGFQRDLDDKVLSCDHDKDGIREN
jgi:hypothetical protein